MLGRTVFAATLLALAQFAVASPPSCLLGAANQYKDPSDIKSVCKDKDLSAKIAKICGDDAQAAMQALADICNEQDVKIADVASPTGASKTVTGSSDEPTSSAEKPSGTAGTTMTALYPTASGGSNSGGSSGRNGTAPIATGGPKSPPSPTGPASVPGGSGNHHNAAGKVEFGFAAVVAGLMAVAL